MTFNSSFMTFKVFYDITTHAMFSLDLCHIYLLFCCQLNIDERISSLHSFSSLSSILATHLLLFRTRLLMETYQMCF
jgi:hypothetical protein